MVRLRFETLTWNSPLIWCRPDGSFHRLWGDGCTHHGIPSGDIVVHKWSTVVVGVDDSQMIDENAYGVWASFRTQTWHPQRRC